MRSPPVNSDGRFSIFAVQLSSDDPTRGVHLLGGFRADLVTIEDADMFRRLSKIGKTMIDPGLMVLHSGRRAHQVGWPRLIVMWLVNPFFVSVYNRSFTREWRAIR